MRSVFKAEMLICQSKASIDVKIVFRKITRLLDPDVRKMLIVMKREFHVPFWVHNLLAF